MLCKRDKKLNRAGGVLVIVAFGMITLLSLTAIVVDVNMWNLEKAKLEQATSAAARAGFVRLKDLDFAYTNPSTRRSVNATIREYLVLNGVTDEEAANAVIKVDKRNVISVSIKHVSGTFFARAAEINSVSIAGAARLAKTNNIAPFAVPRRFQDDDHNQIPNFVTQSGQKGFIGTSKSFQEGHPYILKFGKPLISIYDDMILIPMDDRPYVIPPKAFSKLKIPTGAGGQFEICSEAILIPAQHMNRSDIYNVGVFRAYGAAYRVLGGEKIEGETTAVNWLLGFAGGSFLIKEKYLESVGLTFKEKEMGNGVLLDNGKPTNIAAMKLHLSDASHPSFVKSQSLIRYVTETLQPAKNPSIQTLLLTEQPQVCTLTGSSDPVTRIMDYSGIPYVAVNDAWNPKFNQDWRSQAKDCYVITDKYPLAFRSPRDFKKFLETATNAKGGKGFDWLHIHHEDFTEGGEYSNTKQALVEGVRAFVREGHHHLFAACLAIETLEIFLAESVFGPRPEGLVREMLDFDNTLAFTDFDIDKSRGGLEKVGWISSIDTEKKGDENRWFLTDYLNARCQNHTGFGGVYLDLNQFPAKRTNPTSSISERMVSAEGSTNSIRKSVLKGYQIPEHNGVSITNIHKPLLILGPIGDPTEGISKWKGDSIRYLTGMVDDDSNLKNGHGEFTYLGGHRPADEEEGTYTLVGNLYEGVYYDWPHTLIPEVLKRKKKDGTIEEIRIDWNGDGKIEGFVSMMRINRDDLGFVPQSMPESAITSSEGWPTLGNAPHGLNSPLCRYTERTGLPNYESPVNSSSAVVMDFNNDGDCDDVYIDCCYVKYKPNIAGHRIYLNNILYGAVSMGKKREEAANLGAVNPGKMGLGEKTADFGGSTIIGGSNTFSTMMQFGFSSETGMPLGTEFSSAPGDFEDQVNKTMKFNFTDERGEINSVLWSRSKNGTIAGPGQVKIVPVVERADDPRKSFYFGSKPHRLKVVGFAKFFIIDTSIDTQTLTDKENSIHYLGGPPLPGEIRGYFLGWVIKPDQGT
jgi:hypothetical protein